MFKYIFSLVLLLHGLIHLMGFAKAFGNGNLTQLTKDVSKPTGILWLFTAFLFTAATILFLLKKESWPIVACIAVLISQVLICTVWKDAKYGSIINFIVLLVAISSWAIISFESHFRNDVNKKIAQSNLLNNELLTNADIHFLPTSVQNYLRYAGVINLPKVENIRIEFAGEMRAKGKNWFKFNSLQYNFFSSPARLFFMKGTIYGFNVPGYHDYQNETARMEVKLFGLFPVIHAKGKEMNISETVTLFNDMCLFAPATLVDKRIQWEQMDSTTVKAIFTNGNNKISAILHFNKKGQLVNFISEDRFAISEMKRYRFSTPVKDYKLINGRNVPAYGETIWHYPEGEFIYGKFYLKSIDYNVTNFKQ